LSATKARGVKLGNSRNAKLVGGERGFPKLSYARKNVMQKFRKDRLPLVERWIGIDGMF